MFHVRGTKTWHWMKLAQNMLKAFKSPWRQPKMNPLVEKSGYWRVKCEHSAINIIAYMTHDNCSFLL
jgi:hypothetical protein